MKRNFLSKLFQASLMCCLAVILTGCDDMFGSEDNPIPAYLSMDTSDVTLKVGKTKTRTAIAVSTAIVEYSSSDPAIATVDANGTVTGVAEGTATITATATGYSSASGKKMFNTESKSYKVIVEVTSSPSTPIVVTMSTPLTIEALEAGATVTFKALNSAPARDIQYSKDDGATWTDGNTGGTGVSVVLANVGDRVMFRGENTYYATGGNNDYNHIDCDKNIKVCGNIMSLIQKTGFETLTTLTAVNAFKKLFMNNVNLIDASDLLLPAETLTNYCYTNMFSGCTNLTAAPKELPATTVAEECYGSMFQGCTNLTTVPVELPAIVMKEYCYGSMFYGCASLTTAPKLPATSLAWRCYGNMFNGCTSLNEVWVKPGYNGDACYNMFTGCTNASTSTFHTDGDWSSWTAAFANINTWTYATYTPVP